MSSPTLEIARDEAYDKLRIAKHRFAAKGWFPATSGNLSVRLAGEFGANGIFAVTASGKDKAVHTDEDFLLVDAHGQPFETTQLKPSAETLIHCELYRLTGCGAIFHVHTVFNNLVSEWFAAEGVVPIEDVELIKAFNIWDEGARIEVPIIPNYAQIPRIAEQIEVTLRTMKEPRIPGFLLRKHGICAWGDDAFAATRHLEAFEFLFEYVFRLLQIKNH
jgi:methylthioribulose-1-phosphate dehydratase